MNALHTLMSGLDPWFWLNVAWHGLLLSVLGWLGVRFLVRDARLRALACFLSLIVAGVAPWLMQSRSQSARTAVPENETEQQAWVPEWKITLGTLDSLPREAPSSAGSAPVQAGEAWRVTSLLPGACLVWLTGISLGAFWQMYLFLRHIRWRLRLRLLTSEERSSLPAELAGDEIRVFEGTGSPCVSGFLRPMIAVPSISAAWYSERQWLWVAVHEREHLRAQDPMVHALLRWIRVIWWWNPFVHALTSQWEQAREEVCDAAATASQGARPEYADFLVDVAAQGATQSRGLSMARSKPARRLKSRIEALLSGRRVSSRHAPTTLLTLLGIVVVMFAVVQRTGFAQQTITVPPKGEKQQTLVTDMLLPIVPGKNSVSETSGVETPKGFGIIGSTTFMASTEREVETLARALFRAHFVEADDALGTHGAVLVDEEFQKLLAQLHDRKDVDMLAAPAVTTLQAQPATMEIAKTRKSDEGERQFVGVKLKLEPEPAGPKLKLRASVAIGAPAKGGPWPDAAPKTNAEWNKVKLVQAVQETALAPREVLVMDMGETRPGRHMTVFIQANALRYDDKVAVGFDEPLNPEELKKMLRGDTGSSAPMSFMAWAAEVIVPRGQPKPFAVPPGISFFPSEPPAESETPEPGLHLIRTINNLQFQELLQQFNDMKEAEADLPPEKKTVKLSAMESEYRVAEWQAARFLMDEAGRKVKFTVRGVATKDPNQVSVSMNRSVEGSAELTGVKFDLFDHQYALFRTLNKVDERGLHYQILLLAVRLKERQD